LRRLKPASDLQVKTGRGFDKWLAFVAGFSSGFSTGPGVQAWSVLEVAGFEPLSSDFSSGIAKYLSA
jgi:hypothetical protein